MANSAGKTITIAEANRVLGSLANDTLSLLHRIRSAKLEFDQYTAANIAAFVSGGAPAGFAEDPDGNNMKSMLTDLAQLADIAEGTATLAVAKDFRAFVKKLVGFSCIG